MIILKVKHNVEIYFEKPSYFGISHNSYKSIRVAPLKTPAIIDVAGAMRYTFVLTDVMLFSVCAKVKSIPRVIAFG